MAPVSFTIMARGCAPNGIAFVTDGSLILRQDALAHLRATATVTIHPQVRELSTEQVSDALAAGVHAFTDLAALMPSRIYPDVFRTGDDVALAKHYVDLLRALPGPVRCGTSGPHSQVMLFDGHGLLGALMPMKAQSELSDPNWPASVARPALSWPRTATFTALVENGLLGEFDGGTWSRLLGEVAPSPDLPTMLRDDPIDERVLHRALSRHYGPGVGSDAACRDGIFIIPPGAKADADSLTAAAQRFAAHAGLPTFRSLPGDGLAAVAEVMTALLWATQRRERIWVVGREAQFLLMRASIVERGPLIGAHLWAPRPVPRPQSFVHAFAERFLLGDVTAITSVARLELDATPIVPAHNVHVLQRSLTGGRVEPVFFVVTDGLSSRPLASSGPHALHRFELVTLSARHDRDLRAALSWLGESIHAMTSAPGAPPIALGHIITIGTSGGLRGWPAFLLARCTGPFDGPWGTTELARVLPISDDERATLRAQEIVMDGFSFVTAAENRDFGDVLDRWYARTSSEHRRPA
jgi:hypothetical protein